MRYKITIWVKGITVAGSPSIEINVIYPIVRMELPKPAIIWYLISGFLISLTLLKEGSIIFEPILFVLLIGIEKNNSIINEIPVPTKKHEKLKAQAFGI